MGPGTTTDGSSHHKVLETSATPGSTSPRLPWSHWAQKKRLTVSLQPYQAKILKLMPASRWSWGTENVLWFRVEFVLLLFLTYFKFLFIYFFNFLKFVLSCFFFFFSYWFCLFLVNFLLFSCPFSLFKFFFLLFFIILLFFLYHSIVFFFILFLKILGLKE